MLAIDDPRWSDLSHCYGPASDIPLLLQQLAKSPGPKHDYLDEPWLSLWSSLCHQEDVFTASYAAVPHLVQIAAEAPGPVAFDFFLLPAAIEVSRVNGKGPAIPSFLAKAYQESLQALMESTSAHRADPWDQSMVLSVAAAQAIAKGHPRTAEALINLDDDWIMRINGPETRE